MKKNHAVALLSLLAVGAAQADPAQTIRDTDLQAQSQSDSAVLATLPGNTHLDVLQRKGAWSQVKTSANQTGWVRMLSLRFDTTAVPAKSDGGSLGALTGLLTTGRTSNTGTVTTGVKGLNEEDLKNAQPNTAELQKMEQLAVDKPTGQAFAKKSKLTANQVAYLPDNAPSQKGGK
jgi:hypothetical protein